MFCRKSVLVTRHQDLCQVDPTCDNAEIPKLSSEIGRFGGFLHILPLAAFGRPNSTKCIQNCHFEAVWALPSVKFFNPVTVTGCLC
jgi:hypothetical protein